MTEKWGFCNLTGVPSMIGFNAGLVNCRVAAYLNNRLQWTALRAATEPKRYTANRGNSSIYL